MAKIDIKLIEVYGIASALRALRLPHGLANRSYDEFNLDMDLLCDQGVVEICTDSYVNMDMKDLELMQKLILSGDEHAKVIRGIGVGVEITAPIWFYRELETYRIGRERLSSESTMHIECKNFSGEELEAEKDKIPMGHTQKTVDTISYQTLRRIYFQRRNHRLPMWHTFCEWIENLPLAKELIICSK